MFKVEIAPGAEPYTREVLKKGTGELFRFTEMPCYVHIPGEPHPLKSRLTLPKGVTQPYAPGMYRTSDDSVRVSPYGEITVRISKLLPLAKGNA